jgi:hypothetical protein
VLAPVVTCGHRMKVLCVRQPQHYFITLCTFKHKKYFVHKGHYQLWTLKMFRDNYFTYKRAICLKNGIRFLYIIIGYFINS